MYKGFNGVAWEGKLNGLMRVGNNYIICDPGKNSAEIEVMKYILQYPGAAFHIFAYNPIYADDLPAIVQELDAYVPVTRTSYEMRCRPKMIIHHAKSYRDMGIMLRAILPETKNFRMKVVSEGHPVRFRIPGSSKLPTELTGEFSSVDQFIEVSLGDELSIKLAVEINNHLGSVNRIRKPEGDVVKNECQRLHPNIFREGIIARFKTVTPESILNSFRDDNDIWNYITCQSEWAPEVAK